MIVQILGWGTMAAIAVCAVLVTYVLIQTGRNPTAWANRVKVAPLPEEPFVVHGDDTVGLY